MSHICNSSMCNAITPTSSSMNETYQLTSTGTTISPTCPTTSSPQQMWTQCTTTPITEHLCTTQPPSTNTLDKSYMTRIPMYIWVIIGALLVLIIMLVIALILVMCCLVRAKKTTTVMVKNTCQPVAMSQLQTSTESGNY